MNLDCTVACGLFKYLLTFLLWTKSNCQFFCLFVCIFFQQGASLIWRPSCAEGPDGSVAPVAHSHFFVACLQCKQWLIPIFPCKDSNHSCYFVANFVQMSFYLFQLNGGLFPLRILCSIHSIHSICANLYQLNELCAKMLWQGIKLVWTENFQVVALLLANSWRHKIQALCSLWQMFNSFFNMY